MNGMGRVEFAQACHNKCEREKRRERASEERAHFGCWTRCTDLRWVEGTLKVDRCGGTVGGMSAAPCIRETEMSNIYDGSVSGAGVHQLCTTNILIF